MNERLETFFRGIVSHDDDVRRRQLMTYESKR